MNIIKKAEIFARKKHKHQKRTGGAPFIDHPKTVATLLAHITKDEDVIAAAWLHDTVEDCGVTYSELKKIFNERIADLVMEVTDEGQYNTFSRLKTKEGILIKFADRLHNLSDMSDWSDKRIQSYLEKSKFWKS